MFAVWLGVYPRKERIDGLRNLLDIPENIVPFSLISIGYPLEKIQQKIVCTLEGGYNLEWIGKCFTSQISQLLLNPIRIEDYADEIHGWSLRFCLEIFWHYCRDGHRAVHDFLAEKKRELIRQANGI